MSGPDPAPAPDAAQPGELSDWLTRRLAELLPARVAALAVHSALARRDLPARPSRAQAVAVLSDLWTQAGAHLPAPQVDDWLARTAQDLSGLAPDEGHRDPPRPAAPDPDLSWGRRAGDLALMFVRVKAEAARQTAERLRAEPEVRPVVRLQAEQGLEMANADLRRLRFEHSFERLRETHLRAEVAAEIGLARRQHAALQQAEQRGRPDEALNRALAHVGAVVRQLEQLGVPDLAPATSEEPELAGVDLRPDRWLAHLEHHPQALPLRHALDHAELIRSGVLRAPSPPAADLDRLDAEYRALLDGLRREVLARVRALDQHRQTHAELGTRLARRAPDASAQAAFETAQLQAARDQEQHRFQEGLTWLHGLFGPPDG